MVMTAAGDEPMTITCTILRVEPPMLLEHTHVDPGSYMRWELEPVDTGCVLRLSHFVTDVGAAIDNCYVVGLHASLARLAPCLAGRPIAWDWDAFADAQAQYASARPRTGGDRSLSRRGSSAGVSGATKRTGRQNRWDASRHRPSPRLGRGRDGLGGPRGRGPSEDRADRTRCAGRTDPPCGRPTPPPPCGRTSRRRCPRRAGGERASVGGSRSLGGAG